jgi:hypothetical protein
MVCFMTRKAEPKPDDAEQSKRFIDAARKAEADETEEGAERALKRAVFRTNMNNRGFLDRKK